ncbi:hypothetical protein BT96DRAFT_1017715 [Gymnopus androsaceus JB14]|uniref:Zn(2)-C6 fungal-type domain-containing protein n=1 Tax=Gymnopus androsaceus JB14 TaxID=1447944 RepID=A0A6A4I053_9AGAR|nr:hypothetical protein BT96DRAFT_1017715 [Gymnopus androsaceus JB14]
MSTYTTLQKGAACMNCRRRKIRCDGQKPKCSSCQWEEDCEYKDTRASTQLHSLEDHISVLEARIHELESEFRSNASNAPPSNVQLSAPGIEYIPPILSNMLMHNFIHKSCSIGFFLHKIRFKNSVLNFGGETPTSALLNTSYLWGMHLSSSANPPEQEAILLSRALQSSTHALSENHPQKIIQCIQSKVLLATYFYRANRTVEGRYHATAAASLVLSSGMHKIRTSSHDVSRYHIAAFLNPLAPPSDAIEEGERINAFWTVLTLDAFWNTINGIPSSIPYTSPMARVDVPWPRMLEEYARTPFDPQFRSSHTIERFLSGVPDSNNSPRAIFAKAAILFERATFIGLELKNNRASQQSQASFSSLDTLIQRFIPSILPLDRTSETPLNYQLCMHSLAHAADIQLHISFTSQSTTSRTRVLRAAKAIADLIVTWSHVPEMEFVDPMLAVLWAMTCKIFIDESVRLQAMGSLLYARNEVRASCERVMAAMEGQPFPLMKHQLVLVRRAFANTAYS